MWGNYTKVALRSMKRERLQAGISVFSLSLGITAAILIVLFARYEWTADTFHEGLEDIYRVHRVEYRGNGDVKRSVAISMPLGPTLVSDLPGVESQTRLRPGSMQIVLEDGLADQSVLFVDPSFLDVFSFEQVAGNTGTALLTNESIVLTRTLANRLFGEADPIGRDLEIRLASETRLVRVDAVLADPPANSSIQFQVLLPISLWPSYASQVDEWMNFNVATFIKVSSGANQFDLQQRLDGFTAERFAESIEMFQTSGWWQDRDDAFQLSLMPLADVRFSNGIQSLVAVTTNPSGLRILLGIGMIVLLLACVNFMTLATGRATRRAPEVGVRKTFGAHRGQVMRQFWGEALLVAGLSLFVGIGLVFLLLPQFNQLAGVEISMSNVDGVLIAQVVGLTLLAGLVAGGYPATVLSRFMPANVLKGQTVGRLGVSFTRAMVVVQLAVSISLIAVSLIMLDQIRFVKSADMGFDAEELALVNLQGSQVDSDQVYTRIREQLNGESSILATTSSSFGLANGGMRQVIVVEGKQLIVATSRIDTEYLATMGLSLIAGRNLSLDHPTDVEQAVLINEAFASELPYENPIGELLPEYEEEGVRIVGIVEDFHFASLRDEIAPMILHMSPSMGRQQYAFIRFRTDQVVHARNAIEAAWNAAAPGQPFVLEYLDARMDQLYEQEERWGRIMSFAALVAVLLACMGLFGQATMRVRQRMREIGIRKVLGASNAGMVSLLSREFYVMVAVAFVVATPPAWLFTQRWLDGFAYHTEPGIGVFALTAFLAVLIVAGTVAGQTWSAARTHPASILRSNH